MNGDLHTSVARFARMVNCMADIPTARLIEYIPIPTINSCDWSTIRIMDKPCYVCVKPRSAGTQRFYHGVCATWLIPPANYAGREPSAVAVW